MKNDWNGELKSTTLLDRKYDSIPAAYVNLQWNDQLVVDGTLCSTKYIDADGNCTFDPTTIKPTKLTETFIEKQNEILPEDDNETCPMCRFMKRGSCKQDFIKWEECVQAITDATEMRKCSLITYQLFKCMRNDEYYDIMTANSDQQIEKLEEISIQQEAIERLQNEHKENGKNE